MAKVLSVEKQDPDITVQFTKSELEKWLSYAQAYAKLDGADWFLANMIGELLDDAEARR